MDLPPEISPEALAAQLAGPASAHPLLLDVRREDEHAYVALAGSVHLPLHELEARLGELEGARGRPVVVYCHHGVRSLSGAAVLRAAGFDAMSLSGGIEAWACVVEPGMRRY